MRSLSSPHASPGDRHTLWGPVGVVSHTERGCPRARTPGVNTIEIGQLDPAANVVPQLVVSVKSEALVPPMEMAIPVSVAVPVFCKLTIWARLATPTVWLAKVIEVGEKVTAGATPVPVRETEIFPCGDWIERVPFSAPIAVGVNFTFTVQDAPLARDDPQLLVSDQFVDAVMLVMDTAAFRLLLSVTGCGYLRCSPLRAKAQLIGRADKAARAGPCVHKVGYIHLNRDRLLRHIRCPTRIRPGLHLRSASQCCCCKCWRYSRCIHSLHWKRRSRRGTPWVRKRPVG